jgi:hypothetical protein
MKHFSCRYSRKKIIIMSSKIDNGNLIAASTCQTSSQKSKLFHYSKTWSFFVNFSLAFCSISSNVPCCSANHLQIVQVCDIYLPCSGIRVRGSKSSTFTPNDESIPSAPPSLSSSEKEGQKVKRKCSFKEKMSS